MTTFVAESQYLTCLKEENNYSPRVFQVISISSHQKPFLRMKTNLSQIQFKFENSKVFPSKSIFTDESESQSNSIKIREHHWL